MNWTRSTTVGTKKDRKSKGKGFAGCRLYGNAMSRRSHNKVSLYNRLADKLAVRLVVLKS
jgi:hypothetical protein